MGMLETSTRLSSVANEPNYLESSGIASSITEIRERATLLPAAVNDLTTLSPKVSPPYIPMYTEMHDSTKAAIDGSVKLESLGVLR